MRLIVLGASGFSYEIADLVEELGHELVAFLGRPRETGLHGLTGLRVVDNLDGLVFDAFASAIGNTADREAEYGRLQGMAPFATLVHPSASISRHASIAPGCIVMQNVVVKAKAVIGLNTILNVASCVAHECVVGDHAHIGPGVELGGASSVGNGAFCGLSSVVLPGVSVGAWAVCGAGAVVTKAVADGVVVAGVPAVEIETLHKRGMS